MTGLITDPAWRNVIQSLQMLVLMIFSLGMTVGLVKPKRVVSWFVNVAFVYPLAMAFGWALLMDFRAHFGLLPLLLLLPVLLICGLFMLPFTREVMTHIFSHIIYDFVVRPTISSPFLWRILLISFGGIAVWFGRLLIFP